jgi:hypothetical protein
VRSYSNHAQVNTCGFPPLEDREASLSLLMGLDFFGSGVLPTEETVSSITTFFFMKKYFPDLIIRKHFK